MCSSVFPEGRILLLSKKEGVMLAMVWGDLDDHTKKVVREQCQRTVHVLHSVGVCVMDTGMHNILFSPETKAAIPSDLLHPSNHLDEDVMMERIFGDVFTR